MSTTAVIIAATANTVGAIIGQIVTTPFSAGVDTLLYTDRRIRAEAFDLVLRSGAVSAMPGAGTDQLWLTGPWRAVPTIDVDRDTAHEAAQHELAKPIYPRPSFVRPPVPMARRSTLFGFPARLDGAGRLVHRHRLAVIRHRGGDRGPDARAMRVTRTDHRLFGATELSAAAHRAAAGTARGRAANGRPPSGNALARSRGTSRSGR